MNKQQLVDLIPRYKTGPKKGQPLNEGLRKLENIIVNHEFLPLEIEFLHSQFLNNPDVFKTIEEHESG